MDSKKTLLLKSTVVLPGRRYVEEVTTVSAGAKAAAPSPWDDATVIAPLRYTPPRRDLDATVVDRGFAGARPVSSTRRMTAATTASATVVVDSPASRQGDPNARYLVRAPAPTTLPTRPAADKTVVLQGHGRRRVTGLAIISGALAFAGVALLLVLLETPASSGLRTQHSPSPAQVDSRPAARPAARSVAFASLIWATFASSASAIAVSAAFFVVVFNVLNCRAAAFARCAISRTVLLMPVPLPYSQYHPR